MNDATDFQDLRWQRLVEAHACGELDHPRDLEFLGEYVPQDTGALAERELLGALEAFGQADEDLLDDSSGEDDEDLIAQVLSRLPVSAPLPAVLVGSSGHAVAPPAEVSGRFTSRASARPWGWLGGSLVAAAALCAAWLLPASDVSSDPAAHRLERPALALLRELPPLRGATYAGPSQRTRPAVVSGKVATRHAVFGGHAGQLLEVESPRACLHHDDALACFTQGTRVRLDGDTLEVVEGDGHIELHSQSYAIMVAGTRYSSSDIHGAHLEVHVDVGSAQRWQVETRGPVDVLYPDGRREHAEKARHFASRSASRASRAAAPPATADAATLLAEARRLRARGHRKDALQAYEELLRRYGEDPRAGAALIAAAELHAQLGHPRKALRHYERYLSRGGALAEEANVGRIEALRKLGKDQEAAAALRHFGQTYPRSRYQARLSAR